MINNKKRLVYTFRTFPYSDRLKEIFGDVIILHKLKNDLLELEDTIVKMNPDYILGVALSRTGYSTIEKYTINQFNNKRVLKENVDKMEMNLPRSYDFVLREEATHSFCNYSMFVLKYYLNSNNINIPFSFIHIVEKDIDKLNEIDF